MSDLRPRIRAPEIKRCFIATTEHLYFTVHIGNTPPCTRDCLFPCLPQFSPNYGGDLGFSIASPAYDLNSDPPAFLGVASFDFYVQVGDKT